MTILEREYKWGAKGLKDFTKVKLILIKLNLEQKTKRQRITDIYFEDGGNVLAFNKTALRLRKINESYEITVKEASSIVNGLAQRQEETIPVAAQTEEEALEFFAKWYQQRWPSLKKPINIFTIKNRREVIVLSSADMTAELSFDNCDIITPFKKIKFYEIEFEHKTGSQKAFENTAKEISFLAALSPVAASKVATAKANL